MKPTDRRLNHAFRITAHGLRRGRAREGKTLQDPKDRLRHQWAVQQLSQSTLPIDLIAERLAERLGFKEVHSFSRAFKRWTGVSPLTLSPSSFTQSSFTARPAAVAAAHGDCMD